MSCILVVDDDSQFRKMVCAILERAGHEVIEAVTGDMALRLYRERPTDLVITDLIMPGKDGIETIIELQKEFSDVKIIAISGGGAMRPEIYLDAASAFGAHCSLTKPIDRKILLAAVQGLVGES